MISTLGLYRPRDTPLHRAPAWLKVLLLIITTVVVLVTSDTVTSLGIMCAALLLLASTAPPLRVTMWTLVGTALIGLVSSTLFLWRGDYDRALDVTADLLTIVSLALAITTSTSMAEMLDFVAYAARPIRAVLPPETLGLMFALMLRALPEVARIYMESRQAARARGLDKSIRAVVFPTTTRTVGFALQLGQAIHARGIGEEFDASHEARDARDKKRTKKRTQASTRSRKAQQAPSRGTGPEGSEDIETRSSESTGEAMSTEEAFERLIAPRGKNDK
ncbi:energy-coupling factor transporter transmembrane component T family protein [Demequina sediminicola]|uniref:energy-coupling factor transporter transmembrane component T family protein n=1 Tax=Demequina sediminicola TaxID=1095026 RepID=UPI00078108E2|nr:energy-coupling factor transporter transmembrane protein EcfT [Demequina sediminicola]